ncbi:hypothetical protein [Acinetobacter sp.]|uniref:hypothetical protein n=1 Tax=Acinetobacter sp. TaxID=472 RepID=UPI0037501B0B
MLCRLAIPRLELSEKDYVNIVDRVKRLLKNHGLSLLGDPELLISHTTLKSVKL